MRHPADRLAALPDAAFASFAERLGGVWPEYEASASPVTPEGTVELSLVRERSVVHDRADPDRAVVRLCRADIDVDAVNDFAVFAAERGLTFAVLATVGEVDPDATRRARSAPVDVYDGVGIVSLARDAGIAIPGGGGIDADADTDPERESGT
ncbi:restriction endonuclease [Halobaculum marinum]|uniref:Restriction endonuclease n=1 Tax=Halobaculum marinum TaxID=3031996 RepID=A0ABD5WT30_9EURY|nr:restriction endonuclease [Halobaculum sp. DT55]